MGSIIAVAAGFAADGAVASSIQFAAGTSLMQGGNWIADKIVASSQKCSDKCCQMRNIYLNNCQAMKTMRRMKLQFEEWTATSGPLSQEQISKGLDAMQDQMNKMRADLKYRRGERLTLMLGIEAVLLVLLILYAYFFIMRRASDAKGQIDEMQDELADLKALAHR